MTNFVSPEDRAYAAGFFDGEGTVFIAENRGAKGARGAIYNMRVMASQVDPEPVLWLQSLWGGTVIRRPGDGNRQANWVWNCFARQAAAFLRGRPTISEGQGRRSGRRDRISGQPLQPGPARSHRRISRVAASGPRVPDGTEARQGADRRMTYPIPSAALDERLGWVGTSGSGKTYNAGGGVERLLQSKARVVIVDPLGVWWGLRLLSDGKTPSPFNVAIFGGPHGDLPLNEHVGALIGETAATMAESCIVDLSEFASKAADRRFISAFLESVYRKANGDPFHLVVDEADLFAPQKPQKGDEVLLGHMENIVRRGRVKGFIPWLISQRPAVLNKNVLSQVDGLIAFMLTASQDRKPLGEWVSAQAEEGEWPAIYGALATLPIGTGVVWLPRRQILKTAAFPAKLTFDSSATPKRGEKRQRRELKPLDLDKLKGKLATVEEQAKANDPRHLQAEVARLTRELAAKPKAAPEWPDQRQEVEDLTRRLRSAEQDAGTAQAKLREVAKVIGRPIEPVTIAEVRAQSCPATATPQLKAPIRSGSVPASDGAIPPGTRPTLAVLASVYPAGMTSGQIAARVGIKKKGSTFSAYKSRLRTAGLIEERDGLIFASAAGAAVIGEIAPLPAPGPELARSWAAKLPGTGPVVEHLLERHPAWCDRDAVAAELGINPGGSTLSAYVSRLFTAGVIEKSGSSIRLSSEVMGG